MFCSASPLYGSESETSRNPLNLFNPQYYMFRHTCVFTHYLQVTYCWVLVTIARQ